MTDDGQRLRAEAPRTAEFLSVTCDTDGTPREWAFIIEPPLPTGAQFVLPDGTIGTVM